MTLIDHDFTLTPISGQSGKAYMGLYPNGDRVFVKMNTTPILAALAREQIAPQLLWSRRTPDGDIMTGQQWLSGRVLTDKDMTRKQIVNILVRLHCSRPLMKQLKKLGSKLESPTDLLNFWLDHVPDQLYKNRYLQSILRGMMQKLPSFRTDHATIVHGDVRHDNWIQEESGLIYLVDWDSVRLTDRMFDVAHVLSHYIPATDWKKWLTEYGYKYNDAVLKKLYWYSQYSYFEQIRKYYITHSLDNVNKEIYALRKFREQCGESYLL